MALNFAEEYAEALRKHAVSNCAFMVYVENAGRLIVIAKDKSEVESKMKAEGFKNSFKILESFSFIA